MSQIIIERLAKFIQEESEQWFGPGWGGLADEAYDLAEAIYREFIDQ